MMVKNETRQYWNNPEIEKDKPYAVTSPDDDRLRDWIRRRTNLERCFLDGIDFLIQELHWKGGQVLDVAAGVCWTSALISKRPEVTEVIAVDYSRHRIEQYAPMVIVQLGGVERKITRVVGDALDPSRKRPVDLVLFNQALYMFPDAAGVLRQCFTLLRSGGIVLVSGERIEAEPPPRSVAWWIMGLRSLLGQKTDETGRVRMTDQDYRRGLTTAGFSYRFQALGYPVFPESNPWPAGNYFGLKP